MNSNHSQTELAAAQTNHLERAKRLLGPGCPVLSGCGRWCLKTQLGAYLFPTRAEAERSTPDPSSRYVRIFDIGTDEEVALALERMPDIYDPDELRRERRAKRAAEAAATAAQSKAS